MFKAITRLFKTVSRLFSGRINETTDTIAEDSHVVREEYNEVIERMTRQVRDIRDAVAGLMTQQERKKTQAEQLVDDIEMLGKKSAGAVAFAKKAASGKSKEEAAQSPEYVRAMEAYKNFSSTLAEKKARLGDLESDLQHGEKQIATYKQQLMNFQRDLQKIKAEKHEAVAEITMAKHQREVNEALAGIGNNDGAEQLSSLRDRVNRVSAQAKITGELAGTNVALEEAEFLSMAEDSMAHSEFDDLIFGAEEAPVQASVETEKPSIEKLPE